MRSPNKISTCWPRFDLMEWAFSSRPKRNHDDNQQLWLTKRSAQARNIFASVAYFTCDDASHAQYCVYINRYGLKILTFPKANYLK